MTRAGYLLDVNVLLALCEPEHSMHKSAMRWFDSTARKPGWGICSYGETGFIRLMTNPKVGNHSFEVANALLESIQMQPGYRFWPITYRWSELMKPFRSRIFGHQQVVDALMLGLAVKEGGIFVTHDAGLKFLAGHRLAANLHVIE